MKIMKTETLARKYVVANGHESHELVRTDGQYHVAVNGKVHDARKTLTPEQAREWYDSAAYQIGARP